MVSSSTKVRNEGRGGGRRDGGGRGYFFPEKDFPKWLRWHVDITVLRSCSFYQTNNELKVVEFLETFTSAID